MFLGLMLWVDMAPRLDIEEYTTKSSKDSTLISDDLLLAET